MGQTLSQELIINPTDLQKCLDVFCEASTTRFNNLKTEIIPLGSEKNREDLIQSRELNGWRIPDEIRIAQDGEATRILGSWQGSNINIQEKWNEIMERQMKTMNRWTHLYSVVTNSGSENR